MIFLEPKRIYNGPFDGHHDRPIVPWTGNPLAEVPEGYYTVPLESAAVFRTGAALTVLTYGTMVWVTEAAVRETGIDAEIIDLRSLWPLDLETITRSVAKTGRCVIVHEATRTSGFGAELAALVQEHCFFSLEAPIERVAGWDTPYPHAQEWAYFPGPARIGAALRARDGGQMSTHVVKVPDIGEGIAEVEVVAWHVQPGDTVAVDQVVADVMTDKATVEVPSPVAGRVAALGGEGRRQARRRSRTDPARDWRAETPHCPRPRSPRRLPQPLPQPLPPRRRARMPSPRPPCAATRASWASRSKACRAAGPTGASCTRISCASPLRPMP